MPDILVWREGLSLYLVEPRTNHAAVTLRALVDKGATFVGRSLVVEARYIEALIDGLVGVGLNVAQGLREGVNLWP